MIGDMPHSHKQMRLIAVALALGIAALTSARGVGQMMALTGKMTIFNYLVGGTWQCTVTTTVAGGSSPTSVTSTETYDVVPEENVLHAHTIASNDNSDSYYGYSNEAQAYWHSAIESHGSMAYSVSRDGVAFEGSAWYRFSLPDEVPISATFTKVNEDERTERLIAGLPEHKVTLDRACRRSP